MQEDFNHIVLMPLQLEHYLACGYGLPSWGAYFRLADCLPVSCAAEQLWLKEKALKVACWRRNGIMFSMFVSELYEVYFPGVLSQMSLCQKGAEYDKYRRSEQT